MRFRDAELSSDINWFHCASLGEYEQARPLIEYFMENDQSCLVTFFSPSGYDIVKPKESEKMMVTFLPLENRKALREFIQRLNLARVFWVKYELWLIALEEIQRTRVPSYLISARFYEGHFITRRWSIGWRKILRGFNEIFVQDAFSFQLLEGLGISSKISGDLRFDNVLKRTKNLEPISKIQEWQKEHKTLVLGSSWQEEENLVLSKFSRLNDWKLIIVPHDIGLKRISSIEAILKKMEIPHCKWSENQLSSLHQVVIIDSIGLLQQVYQYANVAFVGGGFSGKLHNILEPLAINVPVVCGPKISNFWEAELALKHKVLFTIHSDDEFLDALKIADTALNVSDFVRKNAGALHMITDEVKAT